MSNVTITLSIYETVDSGRFQAGQALLAALSETPAEISHAIDPQHPQKGIDPVAVAALVLSIPGAIVAILDLKKRIESTVGRQELKQRIEPYLEELRGSDDIILRIATKTINIGQATAGDILDAIADAEISQPSDQDRN